MTNLIASIIVSLVTNVVETPTDFASFVPMPCPDARPATDGLYVLGCLVNHTKGVDPRGKVTTTTCQRRTVLEFEWLGQKRTVEHLETLWQSNRVEKLEWVVK